MRTTINPFIAAGAVISIIIASTTSCQQSLEKDILLSDTSPENSLILRSDMTTMTEGEFEVTQKMAELFIKANNNSEIVSIEPYSIDGVTCFYIINFDKGFKIIAADKRIQPVLAQSDSDNLFPSNLEQEGVKIWLEDTADKIRILKRDNPTTKEDYTELWNNFTSDTLSSPETRSLAPNQDYIWIKVVDIEFEPYNYYVNVNHLMSTEWGQDSPWNTSMPNDAFIHNSKCLAGCAPVAVGQVLYYFNSQNNSPNDLWHNISISGTAINGSYLTVTLSKSGHTNNSSRWAQMPLTNSGTNTSYVSDLLLDLGERLVVHYSRDVSYIDEGSDHSIPYLNQCGITSSISSFNYTTVKNNISEGKPVIVKAIGATALGWISGGHVWVIDGCKDYLNRVTTTTTYYYIPIEDIDYYSQIYNITASYSNEDMLYLFPNAYDGMQSSTSYYDHLSFIRMNWGYDGFGKNTDYGVTDTASWVDNNNNNYLYYRYIHYNISTSQLN